MTNELTVNISNVTDVSKMTEEKLEKAKEIAKTIVIEDSQSILQYGIGIQSKISGFSDAILSEVRSKDSGHVGEILNELVTHIRELNVDSLSHRNPLENAPIIGLFVNSIRKFVSRFEKLNSQLEKIVDELEGCRMQLLKDIAMLDGLFEKNVEYLDELDLYIAAGQFKLHELKEIMAPELEKQSKLSDDPIKAQQLQDFYQLVNRFEKKIHDLKLSRTITIQTAPQIRLIQNNNQLLVEKIQSSVLTTIPLWKNQIVIAISLFRQNKAVQMQKEVTKTTNDLLLKNSELLKQNSLEVAKESETGIVEIETLKKVNNDLLTTVNEILKIQQEGRTKRMQIEGELVKLETELREKLLANSPSNV